MQRRVVKMQRHLWAQSNMVYVSDDFEGAFCALRGFAFKVHKEPQLQSGTVSLSQIQRSLVQAQEGDFVDVVPIGISRRAVISTLEISLFGRAKDVHLKTGLEKLSQDITTRLAGIPLTEGQEVYLPIAGEEDPTKHLIFIGRIEHLETLDQAVIGVVQADTRISIKEHPEITILGLESALTITSDFNFQEMEIGGLQKAFGEMFRRAFIQRTYPPEFIQKMGISHIKGIMLYGPPGTGKTLIARKMSALLHSAPPKIVNGPEILNKYVGQSEENIRRLFEDAEADYRKYGEKSPLHVIIFDEIDAICKSRGSSNGVGDQVVNQLLSKIDGVECLNNILVIGMTNRLDLIDDALLRPGRFEIHIEIALPDAEGRLEILRIHTRKMAKNCFLGPDVDLAGTAGRARNFTGAEITALVKSAASFALERSKRVQSEVIIGQADFDRALMETAPAFGVSRRLRIPEPFYTFPSAAAVLAFGDQMVQRLITGSCPKTLSVLLSGRPGTGKTVLAEAIAKYSEVPFIRVISPRDLVGREENEKVHYIKRTFKDAYRSTEAVVVLDDIEGLMDYVSIGPRFSNAVLQAIKIFAKNQEKFKVLVVGTTADASLMEEAGILGAFDEHLPIPVMTSEDAAWFAENSELRCEVGKTIREVIQ
ncbi:vesicle-fusing ATPase [Nematocida homosporus]|uniref:vesicle-fusing ATPase n=1 Tax=Nematocida homosporus TaxID=1912981 RepID=UPI00221E4E23|nr:vesicle-fusing ATPase [Nematocida homosporus]KAI5187336.1 vesicle-fusing ATPase [Nematocida homosporus]